MANSSISPNLDSPETQLPPPPPPPSAPNPLRSAPPPLQPRPVAKPNPIPQPASTPQPASAAPVKAPVARSATEVAKAEGGRWRGDVPPSKTAQPHKAPPEGSAPVTGEVQQEAAPAIKEAPAWLVSLIVHLVLLLLLALMTLPTSVGLGRLLIELGKSEEGEEIELSAFTLDASEMPEIDEVVDQPIEFEQELILESIEPMELIDNEQNIPLAEFGTTEITTQIRSALSGRSGAVKQALLAATGGSQQTQDAVALGLAWLKRNQKRDGSWSLTGRYSNGSSSENLQAATAMAMLAFQGDGNTHQGGEYQDVVKKAMSWLLRQQDREGSFMNKNRPASHQLLYAQGQCMIAICELYAMTQDSALREPAQRAINYAVEIQSKSGGWRYRPYGESDTSVTGWFMMGLQSGRMAGLEVPPSSLMRIGYYLDSVSHYDGAGYAYRAFGGSEPSPSMTAEGLLCRQYLGWQRNTPALEEAVFTIAEDYNFDYDEKNFYYWYYASQVLHHYGGKPWKLWNDKMRVALPAGQVKTGSEAGSWDPRGAAWGPSGGRLYTTCLGIYCLEVYYRHMPLYKHRSEGADQSEEAERSE